VKSRREPMKILCQPIAESLPLFCKVESAKHLIHEKRLSSFFWRQISPK
jgi:hypothetical protein